MQIKLWTSLRARNGDYKSQKPDGSRVRAQGFQGKRHLGPLINLKLVFLTKLEDGQRSHHPHREE